LQVSINTHGLYSPQTRAQIAGLPIELFIVSLDGLRDVNDAIRGMGVFDWAVDTAAWLLGLGRSVLLGVHLTRSAVDDVAGLIALAAELGAGIKFAPVRPIGRAQQHLGEEILNPEDLYRAVRTVAHLRRDHPGHSISTDFDILQPVEPSHPLSPSRASCPAGRSMLNVNYDGYVYPCAFLVTPRREFAAGHLHQAPLLSLWRESPVFLPFRMLEKDAVCQDCFAYGQTCVGGCVAVSYWTAGRLDAHDPTCFVQFVSPADLEVTKGGD
jgi:radical SAM protein with 4Fe4S-binding SPASM domain